MSEHTKGRLEAYDLILRGDPDGPTDESQVAAAMTPEDARRLAACWNRLLPFSTEEIEKGIDLVQMRFDLVAARALLREVKSLGLTPKMWAKESATLESRIASYLDACDTLEGKPNAN